MIRGFAVFGKIIVAIITIGLAAAWWSPSPVWF